MRTPLVQALGVVAVLMLGASNSLALINPNFTPIHLVNQAELVLVVKVGPVGAGGEIPLQAIEAMKGKAPAKAPTLDFSKSPKPQVEALQRMVGNSERLGVFFVGKFREETPDGAGAEPAEGGAGLLHVQGRWFRFLGAAGGAWLLDILDEHMEGTWAGGTDMLQRAVRYVLTDPAPMVPVKAMARWFEPKKIAKLDGKVHGAIPVDIAGDGQLALHVLCEGGDRVFRWDKAKKALADATGGLKLGAKSLAAAWADLNSDGRLDLASYDGKALPVWLQARDGTFPVVESTVKFSDGCLGLTAMALDEKGRTGILVSTSSYPLLVAPQEGGVNVLKTGYLVGPAAGKFVGSNLGAAHPCLIADFDGDNLPDVLQPFAKGIVLYRAKALGVYQEVTRSQDVGTGDGVAGTFLGDYDADGLLDVFVAADERCFIWHNRSAPPNAKRETRNAKPESRTKDEDERRRTIAFEETLPISGEIAYISKPNAMGGMTGDVNNDGRQDVLILYSNRSPHIFFNRGFRSFGHAHELDIDENRLLEAASEGQQAGCLADLDGDGGQDMAIVLNNGELWVLFRDTGDAPALALRGALPAGGFAGPLTVTGWSDKRCLGAWNVVPGTSEAFFGQFEPGPLKLRWQFPGKEAQEKQLIVEDKPLRFVLKP